jgi:hypothetical protein
MSILEEVVLCKETLSSKLFSTLETLTSVTSQAAVVEAKEEVVLDERIIRLSVNKLSLVLSGSSFDENVLTTMSDDVIYDSASSNLMKESTKYDMAMSEKTSVYSSNVGQSKTHYDESVDLLCLDISNMSFKIDLCPTDDADTQ